MTEAIVVSKDTPLPENISVEDIRAIIRVTASVEIIAPYMISMILEIAGRYLLLIHKVASLFLPAPLLSRLDKKNYILAINEFWKQERGSKRKNPKIEHYIDSIFSKGDLTKYMIPGSVFIFPDDIFLSLFSQ
jgi:hypothetical protein